MPSLNEEESSILRKRSTENYHRTANCKCCPTERKMMPVPKKNHAKGIIILTTKILTFLYLIALPLSLSLRTNHLPSLTVENNHHLRPFLLDDDGQVENQFNWFENVRHYSTIINHVSSPTISANRRPSAGKDGTSSPSQMAAYSKQQTHPHGHHERSSSIATVNQCPQSDDHHILLPCTCNSTKKEILCRGGGSSTAGTAAQQLRNTFIYYARWIPVNMQRFDYIYINLRNLTNLQAGLFNGLKFANILLSGSELTFVDRDAFRGTEQHVYTVFIYGTNLSSRPGTQYDFFASIRTLTNLQKLIIFQNNLTEIPESAFTNTQDKSSQLTEIQITSGSIRTISADSFASLVHLESLSLSKNRINMIRSYAFRMIHSSNSTLLIDLTDNELNASSFEPEAFLGAKRPLKVHLGLNGCNSKLNYLPEEVFRPFLDENPKNSIDVGRHCFNLQCGCRMAWILSEKYRLRVKNFRCSDDNNHPIYFSDYMRNETCEFYRQTKTASSSTYSQDQTLNEVDQSLNVSSKEISLSNGIQNETLRSVQSPHHYHHHHHHHNHVSDSDYCSTKKCSKQIIEMNTYINRSVDPCDSFYDFACNGWENKHLLEYLVQVLSNGGSEYNNFVKVQLKIEENFERLLTIDHSNNVNAMGNGQQWQSITSTSTTLSSPSSPVSTTTTTTTVPTTMTIITNGSGTSSSSPGDSLAPSFGTIIKPIANTKQMFTKCLQSSKEPNMLVLNKVLDDIGGWPMLTKQFDRDQYRWEKYFDIVFNHYNDKIFIEIESAIDEHHIKHLMLSITFIKSGGFIVSRRKLLSTKLNRMESYANYILATLMHFGATNHQNETMDEVWEMIKFEKKIADIAKRSMGSEFMIERRLDTIGCLIHEIDWLYILNNIQRTHRLANEQPVFTKFKSLFDIHYLIDLSQLLARTDQRIISNYIAWRVIDSIGFQFAGTSFIDIQQNFYGNESKEGLKALKKQCLEPLIHSVPYLMARIFAERHLSDKTRENARQIIEKVKNSFIDSMKKKDWIDEPKQALIAKVENIIINIGYPDWIMNDEYLESFHHILNYTIVGNNSSGLALLHFYSNTQLMKIHQMLMNIGDRINKTHFWDPLPLHVGATYDFVGNIITIPMGLLQSPFYEDDRPFYLNYASLGSFFGHEMAHSVTPRYSEYDQLLPPWDKDFLKKYLFKAQCFVSQYTSYYDKEADVHLDGTRTFEEDMSDLAGIQAAYGAYQEVSKRLQTINATFNNSNNNNFSHINGSTGSNSRAQQELADYNNDMLFFISFAQKWCRSNTYVQTRIRVSKSVHSPEKYRVNGALSNLDAFAKTFNCPLGTTMNPVKRCESW